MSIAMIDHVVDVAGCGFAKHLVTDVLVPVSRIASLQSHPRRNTINYLFVLVEQQADAIEQLIGVNLHALAKRIWKRAKEANPHFRCSSEDCCVNAVTSETFF